MANALLDAADISLEDLFKQNLFLIPVYQRPYSWNKDQVKPLLDDLYQAFLAHKNNEAEFGLFAGTIILHDNKDKNRGIPVYNIIDGQQRIATFSLFFLAAYCLFNAYGVDSNDETVRNVKNCLWKRIDRKNQEEMQILRLNSIEKKAFDDLFSEAFERPKKLKAKAESYSYTSKFEKNVIQNLLDIFAWLENAFSNDDSHEDLLSFVDFVLAHTKLVQISSSVSENKAFGIFESINGKAKALDIIDLIKTHIFSRLSEDDYSDYLEKWGELILKTHDNFYDYLLVFIRAYFHYYKTNMSLVSFASLDNELIAFYKVPNIAEAYKALLEDMVDRVECYQMLSDCDLAYDLIKQTKFRFYFLMFTRMDYQHPKALFFRAFNEVKAKKLGKGDAAIIVIEITKFMIAFLTINGRDSKDVIPMFSTIAENIYKKNLIVKDFILYQIKLNALTDENTSAELRRLDVYDKNKKLGSALLSIADSVFDDDNGKKQISWDDAYTYYLQAGDAQSLDHLLVKDPTPRDPNVRYYEKNGFLRLRPGSDFPPEFDEKTPWVDFRSKVLNIIGNLDLKGHDANARKRNKSSASFCTYAHIRQRSDIIVPQIMAFGLHGENPSPSYDPVTDLTNTKTKIEKISLSLKFSYTKKKIIAVHIAGASEPLDVASFKEALEAVADYLYSLDPSRFKGIADRSFAISSTGKTYVSHAETDFTQAYQIPGSDIYLETVMNADTTVRFIKALIQEYGINPDSCFVEIDS